MNRSPRVRMLASVRSAEEAVFALQAGADVIDAKDPSRGVLVVTHDPRILPFADRVVRIEDGRIVGEARGGGKLSKGSQDSGGIYNYAET